MSDILEQTNVPINDVLKVLSYNLDNMLFNEIRAKLLRLAREYNPEIRCPICGMSNAPKQCDHRQALFEKS